MSIKQISEFETGLKGDKALKADKEEKLLIENRINKKNIFVLGNYSSGTRWLNYLIINNTPENNLYSLRNQNNYIDDENNIQKLHKHDILNEKILSQRNLFIIYIIRDFDSFLPSFIKGGFKTVKEGIIVDENMNVYDWYCDMIKKNITLLRENSINHIIVNMKQVQKDNGENLLNILETCGFNFTKPYHFVDKHTKTGEKNVKNRIFDNIPNYNFNRNNIEIESIVEKLYNNTEINFKKKENKSNLKYSIIFIILILLLCLLIK